MKTKLRGSPEHYNEEHREFTGEPQIHIATPEEIEEYNRRAAESWAETKEQLDKELEERQQWMIDNWDEIGSDMN